MLVTEKDFTENISKMRGVKSVSIYPQGIGSVAVTVRYSSWTYLIPGVKWWCNKKLCEYIYNNRPCNLKVEVNDKNV